MQVTLRSFLLMSVAALAMLSCGAAAKKEKPSITPQAITEQRLMEINEDARFVTFFYTNGKTESGILLRWKPDSILVQTRGQGLPHYIPSDGITQIEVVTGNKALTGFAWGTLVAAAYAGAVRIDKINGITFLSAVTKLLGTPAIMVIGTVIGASRETKELYYVPPDFIFDYDLSKRHLLRRN
jgi:hypothetical protein